MHLFIDHVDPSGTYISARATSTVDPSLPVGVLTSAVFLSATGQRPVEYRRVFHVESGRFLGSTSLHACEVGERDTLVIVNCDVAEFCDDQLLMRSWWQKGGPSRRCARPAAPQQWC